MGRVSAPPRVHVVARNYQHFKVWCDAVGLKPTDPRLIYVASVQNFHGYNDISIIFYGPWAGRKDYDEIWQELRMLRATGQLREPVEQDVPRRPSFLR